MGAAGAGGDRSTGGAGASLMRPVRLRVELNDDPLAVPSVTPRLRWELESLDPVARGLSQAGYELLVGSSPEILAEGKGDLFTSGAVDSKSSSLVYAGTPLHSSQRAYWKVRVRDQAGQKSAWSEVAEFTIGLLAASDWGAAWIAGPTTGMPIFRRDFSLGKPVRRALLSICGLGQYEVRVNGANVSDAVMEPAWTNCRANT